MTEYDLDTLRFYQDHSPDYIAGGPNGVSRHLTAFMGLLPAGANILDLGCGGGRDAKAMLDAGFDVDPTDGAAAMAKLGGARLGRPVRVMRFDELTSNEQFDGVWASASLLHVPREELPQILARVHRALKTDGVHCASYKAGDEAGRDRVGRYFNYLARDELVEAYRKSGDWLVCSLQEYQGGGYDNGSGPWLAITARKR